MENVTVQEYRRSYKFHCDSQELLPKYLWYLFEARGMDKSKIISFNDRNVRFSETGDEYVEVK